MCSSLYSYQEKIQKCYIAKQIVQEYKGCAQAMG